MSEVAKLAKTQKNKRSIVYSLWSIVFLLFLVLSFTGCATLTYPPPEERKEGVYHRVKKDETLWSISKAYGVSLKTLADSNRIPNADKISVGQLIFIPKKFKKIDIVLSEIDSKYESFIWPVKGNVISHFGSAKFATKNKGIDISASFGENIVASRSGKITYCSDFMKGYGKIIIIDHGNGYQTVYAYNSLNLVRTGDYVKRNQVIAKVGKGGRAVKPSLHFEIRKEHEPQNPFYYLP